MTNPLLAAAATVVLAGQPTIPSAAYLLLGPPTETPIPSPIYDPIMCQLPNPPAPFSGHKLENNHISVRWVGWHPRHRRCHRWGRGWRCR